MSNFKSILITGANSGLGYECAKNIARSSNEYEIIMACRNPEKAEAQKMRLMEESGNPNIRTVQLDVSSLESVRSLAKTIRESSQPPLYGLICNAGISREHHGLTADGFDIIFGTNYLGHFLLTLLLLPCIREDGRIAVTSSDMHDPNPRGRLTWPGVAEIAHPLEDTQVYKDRYSYSKLCFLYFTYELSKRLQQMGKGITVNAFNPGRLTTTNFAAGVELHDTPEFLTRIIDRIGELDLSGLAYSKLMTSPLFGFNTGLFYDRGVVTATSPLSYNKDNAIELWNASVAYTGIRQEDTLPGLLGNPAE